MIFDRLILASGSPRRRELLADKCKELIILPQDVEEVYTSTSPREIVMELSRLKLGNLDKTHYDDLVIASDTIVWYNDENYGKPNDANHAREMLHVLSGKEHQVYTGFSVAYKGRIISGYDCSDILFKTLTDDDIDKYVKTGSPLDKAGSYGVQDGVVVDSYTGNLDTIVGLPVGKVIWTCEELISNE